MYSTRSGLILGFHGCDESILHDVLTGKKLLEPSTNQYDWLGHGVYFFPRNKPVGTTKDLLLRELDCAVIETLHQVIKDLQHTPFDSIRGVFWEGQELYTNAGFREKDHIQICIRNPNCIKGYFLPKAEDIRFSKV